MDKQKQTYFNFNDFLFAISESLDFIEMDLLGVTTNHSKRVAYIALSIAKEMNFSNDELIDLAAYSILHDNGLSKESNAILEEDYINSFYLDNSKIKFSERFKNHCILGEENIQDFPFKTNQKNIIKYHHEYYNGSGVFGLKKDEIPLMSAIISFADTIDAIFDLKKDTINKKNDIFKFVIENKNILFDENICNIFLEVSKNVYYWLDLLDEYKILEYIYKILDLKVDIYDFEKILSITSVFTKIIDLKSNFTYKHSSGLTQKCEIMAKYYGFDYKDTITFKIAASLHDLGKLAISNKILDKAGPLSDEEKEIMKSHVYYTRKALSKIQGFEHITNWASNHHEKLNGQGYPYGLSAKDLSLKDRLMACLDIYQALTEDRPYRDGMSHKKAISIMQDMAKNNEIDSSIVEDINKVFG